MYFRLTNSLATFQTLMNTIFADLIMGGKVAIYMDNILIYSANEAIYREMTYEVLRRFEEYNLYLKPEKCRFDYDRIEYLGMIIEPGHISMDHGKTAAVTNWLQPRNLRDIREFLGFANFYRQFIKDFSAKAHPLNDLIKKDTP